MSLKLMRWNKVLFQRALIIILLIITNNISNNRTLLILLDIPTQLGNLIRFDICETDWGRVRAPWIINSIKEENVKYNPKLKLKIIQTWNWLKRKNKMTQQSHTWNDLMVYIIAIAYY